MDTVRTACGGAAAAWASLGALDTAQGRGADASQAKRTAAFFRYAAAATTAEGMRRDLSAATRHAARYGTPQGGTRGRVSDYRGACGSLFGGAY